MMLVHAQRRAVVGLCDLAILMKKKVPIAKLVEDERAYYLLEHVGTKPNVVYQVKVRNNDKV